MSTDEVKLTDFFKFQNSERYLDATPFEGEEFRRINLKEVRGGNWPPPAEEEEKPKDDGKDEVVEKDGKEEKKKRKAVIDIFVSNFGRVQSVRSTKKGDKIQIKKMNYRDPTKGRRNLIDNYPQILHDGKKYYIHKLVAHAFLEREKDKPIVDHINGLKFDCRAINLRYCTFSENSGYVKDQSCLKVKMIKELGALVKDVLSTRKYLF